MPLTPPTYPSILSDRATLAQLCQAAETIHVHSPEWYGSTVTERYVDMEMQFAF